MGYARKCQGRMKKSIREEHTSLLVYSSAVRLFAVKSFIAQTRLTVELYKLERFSVQTFSAKFDIFVKSESPPGVATFNRMAFRRVQNDIQQRRKLCTAECHSGNCCSDECHRMVAP